MHELSIVRGVFKTLSAELSEEEMDNLLRIELTIGPLANVEPILLENAFQAFKLDQPQWTNVQLLYKRTQVKIKCVYCAETSLIDGYNFYCSSCGKPCNNILTGDELLISKVEYQTS